MENKKVILMVATSFVRGNKIFYDEDIGWIFENGDRVGDVLEVCPRCCQSHSPNDCDYCLKSLQQTDFIVSACCGHNVEQGYIQLKDGRLFREVIDNE